MISPTVWKVAELGGVTLRLALAGLLVVGAGGAAAQKAPRPDEFVWRAGLTLPSANGAPSGPSASVVRLELPADALAHLQGRAAEDVRVFNAAGEAVPTVRLGAPQGVQAEPARTQPYTAHPLFAPTAKTRARDAVEVQFEQGGAASRAWVRITADGATTTVAGESVPALPAVLVDLRAEKQSLQALALDVQLPANVLVAMTVSVSSDLKSWTTVDTTGPLYRFEGTDAPASTTLGFRSPLGVQGRYLRLAWSAQGVQVRSVQGVVAPATSAPARVRLHLPAGQAQARDSLTWMLPFATPIQGLVLTATEDATLLPVRVQGRNDSAQPWHALGAGVVYRLVQSDGVRSNAAFALGGASVRQLRVTALPGQMLPANGLQAALEFDPVRLVFLAQGQGPFTLAVGRSQTSAAWGDAAVLAGAVSTPLQDLPLATVGASVVTPAVLDAPVAGATTPWLPQGLTLRTALLWSVLGLGVLVLGAVAYALVRQLGRGDANNPKMGTMK